MKKLVLLLCLLSYVQHSLCHLCLIFPEQRGSMDITKSGSDTCFRHGPECGGQPPQSPGVTPYMGGSQMWIKIQQNFNHYEVGFPGYMDIAIAPLNSSDFQTLAFISDFYVYAQDHQENFTTIVMVPNIDCDHCVIRARYNPHKPGEDTFYQCADIKVKKSDGVRQEPTISLPPLSQNLDPQFRDVRKKINMLKFRHNNGPQFVGTYMVGLSFDPFKPNIVSMMNISIATGYPFPVNQYDWNIATSYTVNKRNNNKLFRKPPANTYLNDAVGAINTKGNLVGLLHSGDPDTTNDIFVEFDLTREGRILHSGVIESISSPINALLPYATDHYYTFTIQEGASPGEYIFVIGRLAMENTGQFSYTPILKSMPEDLYVNFQWAEYDASRNLIYVLMGNENSPDQLQARIYTFNLSNMTIVNTEIDVSQYTFMAMHLDPQTGKLYAVSPGLFYQSNTQWLLIEVNPSTGTADYVMMIADFGYFAHYYGGSVFNGISQQGILYHVFRLYDTNADVIAAIDLNKKTLTFSEMTNIRNVHNLAIVHYNLS